MLLDPTTAKGILRCSEDWTGQKGVSIESTRQVLGAATTTTHDDLLVLGNRLFILLVVLRGLVDLYAVVVEVSEDPLLERGRLVLRQGV